MNADVHFLYESSFYRIMDFRCKCDICSTSKPEHQDNFCISYIRKGNFIYNVFRNTLDAFSGQFLISKPDYEHTVTHFNKRPDQCTIFSLTESFYQLLHNEYLSKKSSDRFFKDNDIHSILIKASPETEFLHAAIIKAVKLKNLSRLLTDTLVIELVHGVLDHINDNHIIDISKSFKNYHLSTIENAKEYIHENFYKDISLSEIAGSCYVSPFHFSRLFKKFTGFSPHQYLLYTRFKNADFLLRNSQMPVTQVCYESGFNNPDHFSAYFRKRYNTSPRDLRNHNK